MSYHVNDLLNFEAIDRLFSQFLPSETDKSCYLFMNII